jgi:feruloyl esterase
MSTVIPAADLGLPTRGAVVTKAKLVPAGLPNPFGEYCLVDGEIVPVDSRAQKIKFNVAMPSHWNGKLAQLGGAGFNGHVVSPLELDTPIASPPPPIARGYVSFGSDSGHEGTGSDASFALNEEQLRNFAGDQLKKTHDAVTVLVKARYGTDAVHSYFIGGSEGGREALSVIQRYPEDYDGVMAMCPARFVAFGLKIHSISRAMRMNNGGGWISKAKAAFLHKIELAACDKLDGLEDSIISNVDACRIDFDRLRCPDGKDTGECFSDAQLKTLKVMHSPTSLPYMLTGGERGLPAYPIGTDWDSSGVIGNASDQPSVSLVDELVRYVLQRDPNGNVLTLDPLKPGKLLGRVQEAADLLDQTSIDIDKFITRGGRWILIHGASDELVSAATSVEYYQRLVAKYGQAQTDKFLRFYLIPGYAHGHGSPFNANNGPYLDALEDWVERGIAPGTLTVVDASPEAHSRSRPMCAYPAWPKYDGIGDPDLASSFSCTFNH